jgi:hypothetical protein
MNASNHSKTKTKAIAANLATLNDLLTAAAKRSTEAYEFAQTGECNSAASRSTTIFTLTCTVAEVARSLPLQDRRANGHVDKSRKSHSVRKVRRNHRDAAQVP